MTSLSSCLFKSITLNDGQLGQDDASRLRTVKWLQPSSKSVKSFSSYQHRPGRKWLCCFLALLSRHCL